MATNRIRIEAPPARVFWVLTDVASFPLWVVGAKRIRGVDPTWPAPGSSFHHVVGAGPVEDRDSTRVMAIVPDRHLTLLVRARPLVGTARVELTLVGRNGGTDLEMVEQPMAGPVRRLPNLFVDALVRARNELSLRRLRRWCEQRELADPSSARSEQEA
jgi:uncharacterized protein YndB with AHSA1/START domain